jgi:hypothetical protein
LLCRKGAAKVSGAVMKNILTERGWLPMKVAAAFCFALLLATGPLGLLQVVAWTGMVWNYTQADGSLLSGLKKTFDGEHPCTMCDSIKAAKEKERTAPVTVVAVKKLEVFPAPLSTMLPPRDCREFVFPACSGVNPGLRFEAPPVPVPIAQVA